MSVSIYDQHRKHTARVGAYAILHNGAHVASITIAYPKDGASRLYAYVHWLGDQMVRGSATGYGYDKRSAAMASAADQINVIGLEGVKLAFWLALSADRGTGWDRMLRDAGFTVCCVAE